MEKYFHAIIEKYFCFGFCVFFLIKTKTAGRKDKSIEGRNERKKNTKNRESREDIRMLIGKEGCQEGWTKGQKQ